MTVAGKSTEPTVFETLDGMRGLGALVICFAHMAQFWVGGHYHVNPFAVDMFFMLSGYVIAFAYEPRIRAGMSAATFMRHRIARLYPLYLVGALAGFLVALVAGISIGGLAPGWAFASQVFMIPVMPNGDLATSLYAFNPPAWTLFFELLVNLVYIAIWRWLTISRLVVIVAVSAVLLVLTVSSMGTLNVGHSWESIAGGLPRAMFGFFIGVLIFRISGSQTRPPTARSFWSLVVVALVMAVCFMPRTDANRVVVELVSCCIVGPLLLYWGQKIQTPRSWSALVGKLGAISYAVYIIHYPVYELARRLNWRTDGMLNELAPWTGMALMAVVVAAAWLLDRYYDGPARAWLSNRLKWMDDAFSFSPRPAAASR